MDDFEAFWREYPKRDGPLNKSGARSSFQRRIKEGVDPHKIIAAAKAYAIKRDWVSGQGSYPFYGNRLIPMAQTWLNQRRYEDYTPEESTLAISPEKEEELRERYRQRRLREGWN